MALSRKGDGASTCHSHRTSTRKTIARPTRKPPYLPRFLSSWARGAGDTRLDDAMGREGANTGGRSVGVIAVIKALAVVVVWLWLLREKGGGRNWHNIGEPVRSMHPFDLEEGRRISRILDDHSYAQYCSYSSSSFASVLFARTDTHWPEHPFNSLCTYVREELIAQLCECYVHVFFPARTVRKVYYVSSLCVIRRGEEDTH